MHWYYTEGELTLKVDGKEHKFSLEELISNSSVYKERRKKVQAVFLVSLILTLSLQLFGGGIPSGQDLYFYVGYFITPVLISSLISFISYLLFRLRKKEVSTMDSILKEHIS